MSLGVVALEDEPGFRSDALGIPVDCEADPAIEEHWGVVL